MNMACGKPSIKKSTSPFSTGLKFSHCNLGYANFSQLDNKGMEFRDCDMQESGFDLAKIKSSKFSNCNLERATFGGTDLTDCDFTTAYNFTINPNNCKLNKTKFSRNDLSGLVAHLDIVLK